MMSGRYSLAYSVGDRAALSIALLRSKAPGAGDDEPQLILDIVSPALDQLTGHLGKAALVVEAPPGFCNRRVHEIDCRRGACVNRREDQALCPYK